MQQNRNVYILNPPPASKTRYLEPGLNGTKPEAHPFITFMGRWRQHRDAASGSRAISRFSFFRPAWNMTTLSYALILQVSSYTKIQ